MNEVLTPEQSAKLKKSLRLPEVSRILAAHELEPAAFEHYLDARTALSDPGTTSYPPDVALKPDFPITPVDAEPLAPRTLDDTNFEADMDAALKSLSISGYTMRVRRRGGIVFTLNGGWARLTGDPDPTSWDPTVKMHVASVSKLVTSMAVTKLLLEKGIDTDTPVAKFLPSYFDIAPSAESITFRHLLTHTSGFRRVGQGGLNDGYTFGNFKSYFQRGVNPADIGQWNYHNGNYIGLRIALAILTGKMDRNANFSVPGIPDSNDTLWDGISIATYVKYVERTVFAPASVTASLKPGDKDSLAYSSTLMVPGLAVDATMGAGTDAWWFSADEILSIMATYWQGDAIVPQRVARQALRYGFGLDERQGWQLSGDIQDCFTKGGYWDTGGGRTQQCVVAFAPDDTVIAAFVNSPIAGNTIQGIVQTHLRANIA
jgi:hypothetical protein